MGNGHGLEVFDDNNDKLFLDFKTINKLHETELIEVNTNLFKALKIKDNLESSEKYVKEFYDNQYRRLDSTYGKIQQILNEKKEKYHEMIKTSFNEHNKHYETEKSTLNKKLEKMRTIHDFYFPLFEDLLNKKKFEEYFQKKKVYLQEFTEVSELKISQSEIPFVYFSSKFKYEDSGSIKYYTSIKDIENKYPQEKNRNKTNKYSLCKKGSDPKIKEHNIFQDNLLNTNLDDRMKVDKEKINPNTIKIDSFNTKQINEFNNHPTFETDQNIITTQADVKNFNNFDNTKKSTYETTQKFSDVTTNIKTCENDVDCITGGAKSTTNLIDKNRKNSNYPFSHRDIMSMLQDANGPKKSSGSSYLLNTNKSNVQLGANERKSLNPNPIKRKDTTASNNSNAAIKVASKHNSRADADSFLSPSSVIITLPSEKLINVSKKPKKITNKSNPRTNSAKILTNSQNNSLLNKSNSSRTNKKDNLNKVLMTYEINKNDDIDFKDGEKRSSSNKIVRKDANRSSNEYKYIKTNENRSSSNRSPLKAKPKANLKKGIKMKEKLNSKQLKDKVK